MSIFENGVPTSLPFTVKNIYFFDIISPQPMMSFFSNLGPKSSPVVDPLKVFPSDL